MAKKAAGVIAILITVLVAGCGQEVTPGTQRGTLGPKKKPATQIQDSQRGDQGQRGRLG
ncbi:hypothetical protein K2X33_02650 [bacterium]|nr:hypothetical protein [bacterium]